MRREHANRAPRREWKVRRETTYGDGTKRVCEVCPACHGNGHEHGDEFVESWCQACDADGWVPERQPRRVPEIDIDPDLLERIVALGGGWENGDLLLPSEGWTTRNDAGTEVYLLPPNLDAYMLEEPEGARRFVPYDWSLGALRSG